MVMGWSRGSGACHLLYGSRGFSPSRLWKERSEGLIWGSHVVWWPLWEGWKLLYMGLRFGTYTLGSGPLVWDLGELSGPDER